jgi:hypothetical protein
MAEKLNIGDRVRVGGGYDMEPQWLDGRQYYAGKVKALIPGQNDMPAVVVVLAEDAAFEDYAGKYLVQNLSHNPAVAAAGDYEIGSRVALCRRDLDGNRDGARGVVRFRAGSKALAGTKAGQVGRITRDIQEVVTARVQVIHSSRDVRFRRA